MNTQLGVLNNSYLEVDTALLRENVNAIIRSLTAGTRLIPVLKSDAYGLGLYGVAQVLADMPEIDCFAVAHVSEAVELRREGIRQDLFVMGNPLPFQLDAAVANDITLTVGRLGFVPQLAAVCKAHHKTAQVQIKIETGLHRIGVEAGAEIEQLAAELKENAEWVKVAGAFTHFAQPDSKAEMDKQRERYLAAVEQLESLGIHIPLRHISASESCEYFHEYDMDAVRIGRRLYMDNPLKPVGDIREVASWRSYVTNVKLRHAGETLTYFAHAHLDSDTMVATVGVGFGDGLNPALAAANAPVLVHGKRCRLLACCMDQCFVDVTGVEIAQGDEVTFFGYDGEGNFLSSQEVANLIGRDEGCGLTTQLSPRVARIYK